MTCRLAYPTFVDPGSRTPTVPAILPTMLLVLEELIQKDLSRLLVVSNVTIDAGVSIAWNEEKPIGKIGASRDEADDLDYLAETAPRGKEGRAQAAADRAEATRPRGQARVIADGLSEEDRVLVAHVGGPKLKGFVNLGVLP